MRRCANRWALQFSLETLTIPGAQGLGLPEGHGDWTGNGRGTAATGGVKEQGTAEGDDPGTWEAPDSPQKQPGMGNRRPTPTGSPCLSRRALAKNKLRRAVGRPVGTTGGSARWSWGVGGPHSSGEVGERGHPDPAERRRAV